MCNKSDFCACALVFYRKRVCSMFLDTGNFGTLFSGGVSGFLNFGHALFPVSSNIEHPTFLCVESLPLFFPSAYITTRNEAQPPRRQDPRAKQLININILLAILSLLVAIVFVTLFGRLLYRRHALENSRK